MCNTFEQKRLKFNKIITARVIFYIIDLFAECEQSFPGVPSSPATSEPQKRASAFPGTRRRELLPGEAWGQGLCLA